MADERQTRVWILSELYYPEESATGYYVTKIAEALAASHDVGVLCAQPTYQARGTKAPVEEVRNHVYVRRCAATALNKDVLTFRIINLLTITASIFFNAVRRIGEGDIALVVTNPPTLPFVALLACKLRRAKLILRVEDVYPEALIAAGIVRPGSVLVRTLNALHRLLYRKVDRVLVLGRDMMQLVKSKLGDGVGNISIITNWADKDVIVPNERSCNPLLKRLGLMDKFVVQYSGNMGRTHDLEGLLECARLLLPVAGIHFLFIGTGAKELWLKKTTHRLGLTNVSILPPQPRADLTIFLNACDIAAISFVKGMTGVSVPSRMYNILAAGKPILAVASGESEIARVIEENHVGWVVQPGSAESIARAVQDAAANHSMLFEMSQRARALALDEYSQPQIIQKFEELLNGLDLSKPQESKAGS